MPGSTNFKRWDEALANMQSDAAYLAEVFRMGGAAPGIFPKEVFNKLAYQTAVMVAALGDMLAAKGYTVEDGSAGTVGHDYDALKTVLANILTVADGVERTTNKNSANGYLGLNGQKGFTLSVDTQSYVGLGRYSAGAPYGVISTAFPDNPNNTGLYLQVKNNAGAVTTGLTIEGDGTLKNVGGYAIPGADGVVKTNLNADMVDGAHVGIIAGTVPKIAVVGSYAYNIGAGLGDVVASGTSGAGYAMFSWEGVVGITTAIYKRSTGQIILNNPDNSTSIGTVYWAIFK